jgi:hypothetical protein
VKLLGMLVCVRQKLSSEDELVLNSLVLLFTTLLKTGLLGECLFNITCLTLLLLLKICLAADFLDGNSANYLLDLLLILSYIFE